MARGKKSKYQKKYKGIQYIAQRLHKYYPKRYTSYTKALPRAREILAELKESGTKVTWGNAQLLERDQTRSIYGDRYANVGRKPTISKRKEKNLRELLGVTIRGAEGVPYFEDESYRVGIAQTSDKVFFTADFLEDVVQGGSSLPYVGVFQKVAKFLDKYRKQEYGELTSDNICYIKFSTPTKNISTKQLISQMYVVDALGDQLDIDIDPIDLDNIGRDESLFDASKQPKTPKKEEKPLKTPKTKSEFTPEQQIEMKKLEVESEKLKAQLQKMSIFQQLLESGMSPKEAQKMMKDMFG